MVKIRVISRTFLCPYLSIFKGILKEGNARKESKDDFCFLCISHGRQLYDEEDEEEDADEEEEQREREGEQSLSSMSSSLSLSLCL
mgnify:CR=1 FL=1